MSNSRERDLSFAARFLPFEQERRVVLVPAARADDDLLWDAGLPVPPESIRIGYGSTAAEYVESGKRHHTSMMRILEDTGFSPQPGDRILELGCAGGRVLRFFQDVADECEVWGVDISAEAMLWCRKHLSPPFNFATTTTYPHLPFEDNYFSLIYAGSVFTHIFDLEVSWLLELRRIVRPGGRLYITVHDEHTIELLNAIPREDWFYDASICQQVRAFQKDVDLSATAFDVIALERDDLFVQTFHHTNYICEHWGRLFDILSITREAYEYQTAVTLTKAQHDQKNGKAGRVPPIGRNPCLGDWLEGVYDRNRPNRAKDD